MQTGHLSRVVGLTRGACGKLREQLVGNIEELAELPDWKDAITTDCPRRGKHGVIRDLCGAHFPDLPAVTSQRN